MTLDNLLNREVSQKVRELVRDLKPSEDLLEFFRNEFFITYPIYPNKPFGPKYEYSTKELRDSLQMPAVFGGVRESLKWGIPLGLVGATIAGLGGINLALTQYLRYGESEISFSDMIYATLGCTTAFTLGGLLAFREGVKQTRQIKEHFLFLIESEKMIYNDSHEGYAFKHFNSESLAEELLRYIQRADEIQPLVDRLRMEKLEGASYSI